MSPLGIHEVHIVEAGESPADRLQSQADKVRNICPTERKRKLRELLFSRGQLVRIPEQESADLAFSTGARGEQERLLPLGHDARHEAMKLDPNSLVMRDAPQKMSVRNDAKDGIFEGDGCDRMPPGSCAEQTDQIAAQREGRNLPAFAAGVRYGLRRPACNGKEMRKGSTLLIKNFALGYTFSLDHDPRET